MDDNPNGTAASTDSTPLSLSAGIAAFAASNPVNELGEPVEVKIPPLSQGGENPITKVREPEGELLDDDDADLPAEVDEDDDSVGEMEEIDEDDIPDDEVDDATQDQALLDFADDKVRVKFKDGKILSLKAVTEGHLRLKDYKQKTEVLANNLKVVAAEREQVIAFARQTQDDRQYVQMLAEVFVPVKPSDEMLNPNSQRYNPQLHAHMVDLYHKQVATIARVTADADRAKAEIAHQEDLQAQHQFLETRREQSKILLERVPDLADPVKHARFIKDVKKAVVEVYKGTLEEFDALNDAKDYHVLWHATKWLNHLKKRRLARLKSEGKPGIAPMSGGGRRTSQEIASGKAKSTMDELNRTHSVQAGIKALLAREGAQ